MLRVLLHALLLAGALGGDESIALPFQGGQAIRTAFNDRVLTAEVHDREFSFLLGGHLYGAPRDEKSVFPAATLLANLERIDASGASFFVGLGDLFMRSNEAQMDAFVRTFTRRLAMPFFNAAGNHCVEDRALYERRFGAPTFWSFVHGHVLFVVLDSELDVGRIAGAQLEFLREQLAYASREASVGSVAIFSHKLIWATDRPALRIVYDHVNNQRGYRTDGSFNRDVMPALWSLANEKPVYWFSGDVGVDWSLPLFHHRESAADLTWIATGLGDTAEDLLVRALVAPSGAMSFEVLRLDGAPARPIDSYGLPYWLQHFGAR